MQNSDEWEPPPLLDRVRKPDVGRAWSEKVRQWYRDNAEIAAAWDEANAMVEEARERGRQELEAWKRVRDSGMSERAVTAYAQRLTETPSTKAVERLMGSSKTFLLLMGSPGCGKTLGTALAFAQRPGLFVRALELARLSSFDRDDRQRLCQVQRAPLLVLDDLGAEMLHDGWRPVLDELIDIRWGDRLKTILTTNLDGDAFKARYGARIADRIRDDGFIEKVGDKSRRGGQ